MNDRVSKTKAGTRRPNVVVPSLRVSRREELNRSPLERVSHVRADFDAFTKDYEVVEFGPSAEIDAVDQICQRTGASYICK